MNIFFIRLFPDHQLTRQGDFLCLTTFSRDKIVLCQMFVEFIDKGCTYSCTFLIYRIQERVGNILNALQTDFGIVGNNLPIVNDIVDVVNAAEDVANEGWATGSVCMNSDDNPRWDSEFKYYQRYIEDMRILTSMEGSGESTASVSGGLDDEMAQKIVEHFKKRERHTADKETFVIVCQTVRLQQVEASLIIYALPLVGSPYLIE